MKLFHPGSRAIQQKDSTHFKEQNIYYSEKAEEKREKMLAHRCSPIQN